MDSWPRIACFVANMVHQALTMDDRFYPCEFCGEIFLEACDVEEHIEDVHGGWKLNANDVRLLRSLRIAAI